jgi:hypothetical protein
MWALMSILFLVHYFTSDPVHLWHWLCLRNCTKEWFTFSHTCTHTKQKQKKQLKLETPKTVLRKLKEGKKEIQQEKTDINNIKNIYRK